tara:strand:+ start:620 stop:1372 length:753 start_codon:yes stop_codon:yes gene_type:complete
MILITRPASEAKDFSIALKRNNFLSLSDSILSFNFRRKKISLSKNKIFIVTSSQSVKALQKNRAIYRELFDEGVFFVVGKKVSLNLKGIGVKNIKSISRDTDHLLRKIVSKGSKYKKLNYEYLCGSKINDDFISRCKNKKILIRKKILYDSIPSNELSKKTIQNIQNGKITVVTFFSIYTAKIFFNLAKNEEILQDLRNNNVIIMCLSRRIAFSVAKMTKILQKNSIKWSTLPNQESMIKSLKSIKKLNN